MRRFGNDERGAANARGLVAFGISRTKRGNGIRQVRAGAGPAVFTVGYERRTGKELISLLLDAAVDTLVDVRQKPISRKADFREESLRTRCEDAGITYETWTELGTTAHQRDTLKLTGNVRAFRSRFRGYAKRHKTEPLQRLGKKARSQTIARCATSASMKSATEAC